MMALLGRISIIHKHNTLCGVVVVWAHHRAQRRVMTYTHHTRRRPHVVDTLSLFSACTRRLHPCGCTWLLPSVTCLDGLVYFLHINDFAT